MRGEEDGDEDGNDDEMAEKEKKRKRGRQKEDYDDFHQQQQQQHQQQSNNENTGKQQSQPQQTYFSSIREALQAAQKGYRIVVCPGVYEESLIIDKSVIVCGYSNNSEQVIIQSTENVVVSSANNAVLRNVTLRQLGGKFNGILVYEGMLTIEHCDISSAGLGCFAVRSAYANLRHNKIHDSPQGGLVFCDGAEGIVEHNNIYGNGLQGIEIREESKPRICFNSIRNSDQNGILIHSNGRGEVMDNDISNNRIDGIMIISGANPSCISNNRIHHNRQRGIFLSRDSNGNGVDPDQNDIHGNAIDFMREQ
jgi:parallel beta-helix repeat protein